MHDKGALICGNSFMKAHLIFSLFCIVSLVTQAQLPERYSQKIDSLFKKVTSKTPGYAVAVLKDNEVIYKKTFGMSDLARRRPITSKTSFDMASISKQFTAMCILLLEERGKLAVEDDVRIYLPELPQYGDTIKIKHLLLHTSGIKDDLFTFAGNTSRDGINEKSLLATVAAQKSLNFKPGEEMVYCNIGL
ncbi:MAG TPA: serine hydrolase domain-containing protein [Flavobacterium sp.]